MASSHLITPDMMKRVWELHINSTDHNLIARVLDISKNSVKKITDIMETARAGGNVDALHGDNYKKQKAFAKEYFGVKAQPAEQGEKKSADEQNIAAFCVNVLQLLERQNELLEKLCEVWGVDMKGAAE